MRLRVALHFVVAQQHAAAIGWVDLQAAKRHEGKAAEDREDGDEKDERCMDPLAESDLLAPLFALALLVFALPLLGLA